jgi:DNA-binding CsgD family transcriptional regulator
MMETQLGRQCNEVRHARPLQRLLRHMAEFLKSRGLRFGSDNLQATRSSQIGDGEVNDDFRPNASCAQGFSDCELMTPTQGELEALRWAMDGMTDAEIGLKVGLPEREVAFRLRGVMRKFGCRTKYEAVLKAIKMRWIEGI